MESEELRSIVLRNTAELSEIRHQVADLVSKEKRVNAALESLGRRLIACLDAFHRDKYKSTDQRLLIRALAEEIQIFDRLGYDIGVAGARFLLGVSALLEGRNQTAADHFQRFIDEADPHDLNLKNAHYLSAMVSYNRRDYARAIDHFGASFRLSTKEQPDWQSKIYVGELSYFLRRPRDVLEKAFSDVEEALSLSDVNPELPFLKATLYLKWANCYADTLDLKPKQSNPLVNTALAVSLYKNARSSLPKHMEPDSLLPLVVDYSLAQALLLARSIDMDLAMTPSELLADVFERLRRIVLTKREEIILAQCYLMLGTCAAYSTHVSKEIGEIYLEYARTQTLTVPSDVCFYSCVTKELLSRDEFIAQIDYYATRLQETTTKRR